MIKIVGILIGWVMTCTCFIPPEVSFSHLQTSSSANYVRSTLSHVGMLAITDIPELEITRQSALSSTHECLSGEKKHGAEASLPDGTTRRTLVLKDDSVSDCPEIQPQLELLHSLVQKATNSIAMALDQSNIHVQIEMVNGSTLTSMAQIVFQAKQLDHFHTYKGNSTTHSAALALHLDAGIFIAFVPPLWKDHADGQASGLQVQLPDGAIESVVLNDNSVVIMMGLAAEKFLKLSLRPVPHSLQVPRGTMRSWYGHMVLLPEDMLVEGKTSFQEFWSKSNREIASGLGCSSSSKEILPLADQANPPCPTGTVDCWAHSPGELCLRNITCPEGVTSICWAENSPMGPHTCINATDCVLKCDNSTWFEY